MTDGFSLVCPACGQAADLSAGLTPNVDGKLLCANCGGEIPIPLAAPDDSLGDTTTSSPGDLPTIVDAQHRVHPAGDDSIESMLGDCGSGRYSQQETIGKGGMGEIVLCVEQNTRREVAMKRMLPTSAGHAKQRARFVEEAQVTAQLEHPNIVPVHELGRDEQGAIYFTMKLVKGRSLAEILAAARDGEETHSLGEMLGMFLKVCDGVAFAHSRGVVHRDLKPANIMVGDFGEVLVMDWGIARILGRDEIAGEDDGRNVQSSRQDTSQAGLHTVAGAAMGSPSYMPPEQALGQHDKIDHRSDIYSLGAILYNILTLKLPVEGQTARVIMDKVVAGDIHPPERRAPERDIPRELSAVAMKCLSKYRRGRYASVPDLQRDISLYLEGRSVSAAPDTFAQAFVKLIKRNKPISVSIAAAAVILIALTSVFVVRLKGERDSAIASEQRAVTAQQQQRATALAASKRFAMQAIRAAETGRSEEASRRITDAETVAIDSPWGPYARGMFARTNNDYPSAADLFRKALEIDPAHAQSRAALSEALARMGNLDQARNVLADVGKVTDWRALMKIGQTLYDTGRWVDSQVVFKQAVELMKKQDDATPGRMADTVKQVQARIDDAQWAIDAARVKAACVGFAEEIKDLPAGEQIKRVQAKLNEVNGVEERFQRTEIENSEWVRAHLLGATHFLEPLRGLPLQYLRIRSTQVRDIGPLKGMPLKELYLTGSKLSDLGPLKGMPLTGLICRGMLVADLAPLKGMSLARLELHRTKVSDLEPLRGMPLTSFSCTISAVSDLGPLKGMLLTHLNCSSSAVSDLSPLKGMPLTSLACGSSRVTDLTPLKGMKLTNLNCDVNRISDLSPLKGMPLVTLHFSLTRVVDLGPLKGLPLTSLHFYATAVSDLSPLQGMPLATLDFFGTKVIDLTPLKGMPLTWLNIQKTQVSDLRPLEGMPLKELLIVDTKVTDLTPLAGMKLGTFSFTPRNITKGIEIVRGMKSISEIAAGGLDYMTPTEFWKKYDAGEFK